LIETKKVFAPSASTSLTRKKLKRLCSGLKLRPGKKKRKCGTNGDEGEGEN